ELRVADRVPAGRRLRSRPGASAEPPAAAGPAVDDHLAQRDGGGGGASDGRDPPGALAARPSDGPRCAHPDRGSLIIMIWRFLGDAVMVFHGALLVFFLIGGCLAWRWVWAIVVHLG